MMLIFIIISANNCRNYTSCICDSFYSFLYLLFPFDLIFNKTNHPRRVVITECNKFIWRKIGKNVSYSFIEDRSLNWQFYRLINSSNLLIQLIFWCYQCLLFCNPKVTVHMEGDIQYWDYTISLHCVIWWWDSEFKECVPQLTTKFGWSVKIKSI